MLSLKIKDCWLTKLEIGEQNRQLKKNGQICKETIEKLKRRAEIAKKVLRKIWMGEEDLFNNKYLFAGK